MRLKLAAIVALALAVAGCGSKGEATNNNAPTGTLTIGASLSSTGSLAREGILTKEGYDVCVNVVNAKGGVPVGNQKMKLDIKYQDDTSKSDVSGQLMDQFNDQGLKLILGPYGSGATAAAAAAVERNKQVMVDSSGADDTIFTKGYKRTFAVLSPASLYATSMVDAINELVTPKPTTIAFISADDGFSKTATTAAVARAQALGFKVIPTEFVPNGTNDVSSALTKIKPSNPDVIIGSAHLNEGVAIVKQSAELGVKPMAFAETVAPPTPDFVDALKGAANGVLGSTQWTIKTPGSDKWFGSAADYAKTFANQFNGREVEYHGAEATAACLALVLAVEKAGSTDPEKVRDALAGLDTPSFFGPLKFNDKGQNLTKKMGVIQIQNGKPVSIWPKDAVEAPLKWPGTTV
jgi:branched-chain amino acid transport system substrate-binding protein